jgi:DNA-binding transcriptional LysR family regulator
MDSLNSLTGVELRHLAALAAIHEERSFRGAADRLGYVQSAVSQQIAQLEALVGTRLVNRTRGHAPPVALTEAGLLLHEHGSRILGQLNAAEADLRVLASGEAPLLRVGADQGIAARLLPPTLRRLARRHPSLVVQLEEAATDRVPVERVVNGALDAAFAELPLDEGPFAFVEVLVDPYVLIAHCESPLATHEAPLTLADLVAQPLVAYEGSPTFALVEAHLRAAGHEAHYAMRATTGATTQALVAAGVGPAILPRLAVDEEDPRIVVIDLGELLPSRRLALYWHEGRQNTPALTALHEAVVTTAREIRRARRLADAPIAPVAPAPPVVPPVRVAAALSA